MWLKEYYEVLGAAIKKSKAYTDSEVAKVRTKFTVVASYSDLPDPGRTDTIYLVPQTGTPNTYDQYIYEDGQYVDIGDTTIDLDNYATDDELADGLALKVDKVTGKGLSTNDYTTAEKTKLAEIEAGAQKNITPDASLDGTSTNAVQNKAVVEGLEDYVAKSDVDSELDPLSSNPVKNKTITIPLAKMNSKLDELIHVTAPKYGIKGIGQSASALTRLGNAVGLTAQVGTDGNNSSVVNDFDNIAPWMRKKCVGTWNINNDTNKPVFTVNAYLGDPSYAEDGSMGDYVAVECPLCYYKLDGDELWISEFKVDSSYHPFNIFKINNDENNLLPVCYLPAYALAKNANGKAVCLPNLYNEQGDYALLYNSARTYKDGALGSNVSIMQSAVQFYEWALFTVEFATQNCQSIMAGCSNLRSDNADKCTFIDITHLLLNNYNAARVVGEHVCISTATAHTDYRYKATHVIMSITRCDDTGTADPSGTYSLLEVAVTDNSYFEYDLTGQTEYQFAARPYPTGACNSVSTPSGSLVSNSNGYYPMKYRHRENPYGNQYHTSCDLFNILVNDTNNEDMLEWYFLPDPTKLTGTVSNIPNSENGQNILKAEPYVKLSVETPHAKYASNYIKSKKYDSTYPDIWIPDVTGDGATATTYFCDYAYLVYSTLVRSARFGGSWSAGAYTGFSYLYGYNNPGSANASSGGDLWVIQNAG